MRLGLFAKTFAGRDPATVLARVAAAGFEEAQYNMACSGLAPMPDAITGADAAAVAAAARRTGVAIAAVSGTYNMIHPDPAVREDGHRRLAALAAKAREMSAPVITLCTGTRDPYDQWRAHPANDGADSWRDLLAAMERAIAIADAHDIALGIEPELANVVSSAARARRLIDELQSARLKIVLDPANLFERAGAGERRRIVEEAIGLLGGHLVMAHAKDRAASGGFAAAGRGVIDFAHFFGRLRAAGFDGPVIAHGLTEEEAPGAALFLRRARDDAMERAP